MSTIVCKYNCIYAIYIKKMYTRIIYTHTIQINCQTTGRSMSVYIKCRQFSPSLGSPLASGQKQDRRAYRFRPFAFMRGAVSFHRFRRQDNQGMGLRLPRLHPGIERTRTLHQRAAVLQGPPVLRSDGQDYPHLGLKGGVESNVAFTSGKKTRLFAFDIK